MARIVAADLGAANAEAGKVEQLHDELVNLKEAVISFDDRLIIDSEGPDVDRLKSSISEYSTSLGKVIETISSFTSACTTANDKVLGVMTTDYVDDKEIEELKAEKSKLESERDNAQSIIDSFSALDPDNKWADWTTFFRAIADRWSWRLNGHVNDIQKDIEYMEGVMSTCAEAASTFDASTSDIVISVKR